MLAATSQGEFTLSRTTDPDGDLRIHIGCRSVCLAPDLTPLYFDQRHVTQREGEYAASFSRLPNSDVLIAQDAAWAIISREDWHALTVPPPSYLYPITTTGKTAGRADYIRAKYSGVIFLPATGWPTGPLADFAASCSNCTIIWLDEHGAPISHDFPEDIASVTFTRETR